MVWGTIWYGTIWYGTIWYHTTQAHTLQKHSNAYSRRYTYIPQFANSSYSRSRIRVHSRGKNQALYAETKLWTSGSRQKNPPGTPAKKSSLNGSPGMTHRAVPEPGRPGRILERMLAHRNRYMEDVAAVRTLRTYPTDFEFLAGREQDRCKDGSR